MTTVESDNTTTSDTTADDPVMPEPPEDILQAARAAPDHWLGMVDPAWNGDAPPPVWAVVGQWRSDQAGDIVEWQENEEYRPSPAALGWKPPTDPVDEAVQRAVTGYGSGDEVMRALARAELAVLCRSDGSLVTAAAPDGTAVVPAFTAQPHLDTAGELAFEVMSCRDLVNRLPAEHVLYLNPAGSAPMSLQTESLLGALAEHDLTLADAPHGDEAEVPHSEGSLSRGPGRGTRTDESGPVAGAHETD
ncbi:type VII secretion system-associated protein [Streptomyces sp. NPDC060000]|uniref:type VII secretion system-associated protein n=1 Tax=Streptomyces sp. NPDC060000 TaxID=3347031 RepID=UPI0036ABC7C2